MFDSLKWFDRILQIPRPSGYEDQITDFLVNIAKEHQYEWAIDHVGNLCIKVPARGIGVGKPVLTLQAHMDMVCEKHAEVTHDFFRDPIQTYEKDGYLYARGTTLGADNGIGIALAMAVSELENIPPLELLFTVEEETSMNGAKSMQANFFQGNYLINLDSENDSVITTGSAGSMSVEFIESISCDDNYPLGTTATLRIDKLLGGHSGEDINKKRGSASKICLDQLILFEKEKVKFRVISFDTGSKSNNAIARFGHVHLAFLNVHEFEKAQTLMIDLKEAYPDENADYVLFLNNLDGAKVFDQPTHDRILGLGYELDHGPLSISIAYPELPEISCNLASIKQDDKSITYSLLYRSFVNEELMSIAERLKRLASRYSVRIEIADPDPAWPPREDNPLLDLARDSFNRLLNHDVITKPVHAGLECGYLERLRPGLYAISIGPNIDDPHSPDEHMELASVKRIEQLLFTIVNEFIRMD